MKRLLSLLLLLSAMQSVAAVPAAADVPAAANNVPAAGRADAILAGVSDGFRALGAYGVSFEVRSDEYVTRGRYAVEGENYYLVLGDAEVYCDGAVRYEVDNRRREVTIDVVDTGSRNILNNPVHAFDFLGSEYAASLAGEQEGRAVVRLTPAPGNTSSAGNIVLTVDTAAMRPVSLRYDYDGEQVQVSIMLLLSVAIPAAMLAAAPEDPSPAGGHTPAAGHDRPAADMPGSVPGAGSPAGQQPSGTAWELTCERDLLYAASFVGDSIPVRVFLESGVYFPLIDSALVWSHPGLFEPVELERPVRFRMAGGTDYSARYKLAPGLRVGDTRSLCESYVVDLRRRKPCDLLYPLHTFTTDSVAAPGIFELDVRRGIFRPLSSGSLPQPGDGWEAYELVPDGHSGMFWVMDTVRLSDDRGRSRAMPMRLVVDLGNANLLALFAFKPEVGKFVSRAPVDLVEGHTPGGMTLRVLMPAVATFMGCYSFGGLPVVVLDKPMKLPGDGFLGVKFFSAFRVVFDFRHGRLWLRLAD